MAPKRIRVLSEAEKVKRRETSRKFREAKLRNDPNWRTKEAERLSEYYVKKSDSTQEKWHAYLHSKKETMSRHRSKVSDKKLAAKKRRGRSSGTAPETPELSQRTRRKPTTPPDLPGTTGMVTVAKTRYTVALPAVLNKCRSLKRKLDDSEVEKSKLKAKIIRIERKASTRKAAEQVMPQTPMREAGILLKGAGVTPKSSLVQIIAPYTATMKAVRNAPMHVKRKLLCPSTPSKSSRGLAKGIAVVSKVPRKYVFHQQKVVESQRKILTASRKAAVVNFLKRPDNSSLLPGKKDQVRGQVRYGLTDTMSNLYMKFKYEYSRMSISKATFFSSRPKYIKLVQWTKRNQCLCQQCANMCLRINGPKVLPKSCQAVGKMTEEQIIATLDGLSPQITFQQWRKVEIAFKDKEIKKTKRIAVTESRNDFKKAFLEDLQEYRQHCWRVETRDVFGYLAPLGQII